MEYLRGNPVEIEALYSDILSHVTGFFRDPEAFETLRTRILPNVQSEQGRWVSGSGLGARMLDRRRGLLHRDPAAGNIGRFAGPGNGTVIGTDVSEASIRQARGGTYTEASLSGVSPQRLRKFFVKVEGGYQVHALVRDICVFALNDLTKNPPFSNVDLISCRNVLSYLGVAASNRAIEPFTMLTARRPPVLGQSESLEGFEIFRAGGPEAQVFSRKPAPPSHFAMNSGTGGSRTRRREGLRGRDIQLEEGSGAYPAR